MVPDCVSGWDRWWWLKRQGTILQLDRHRLVGALHQKPGWGQRGSSLSTLRVYVPDELHGGGLRECARRSNDKDVGESTQPAQSGSRVQVVWRHGGSEAELG